MSATSFPAFGSSLFAITGSEWILMAWERESCCWLFFFFFHAAVLKNIQSQTLPVQFVNFYVLQRQKGEVKIHLNITRFSNDLLASNDFLRFLFQIHIKSLKSSRYDREVKQCLPSWCLCLIELSRRMTSFPDGDGTSDLLTLLFFCRLSLFVLEG